MKIVRDPHLTCDIITAPRLTILTDDEMNYKCINIWVACRRLSNL